MMLISVGFDVAELGLESCSKYPLLVSRESNIYRSTKLSEHGR